MFVFVESVKAQHVGDAFCLSNRSAGSENGDHSAPDFDATSPSKRLESELREIGAQADFTLPMGHHGLCVRFLRLR